MLRYMNDTNGRWYTISLQRDLFGQLIIKRTWGSTKSRKGGEASDPVACPIIRTKLRELVALRHAHGYRRFRR